MGRKMALFCHHQIIYWLRTLCTEASTIYSLKSYLNSYLCVSCTAASRKVVPWMLHH